ncbi:MAG: hypothetical protein CK424_00895 [Legionella sp.]|nr:MAG: hypothetical protein CK424_00895 [Legionella sp.]
MRNPFARYPKIGLAFFYQKAQEVYTSRLKKYLRKLPLPIKKFLVSLDMRIRQIYACLYQFKISKPFISLEKFTRVYGFKIITLASKYLGVLPRPSVFPTEIGERRFISLKKFTRFCGFKIITLAPKCLVVLPRPFVFPTEMGERILLQHSRCKLPSVYVSKIRDATIYGDTNMTFAKNHIIHNDLLDPKKVFLFEEYREYITILPSSNRALWGVRDESPLFLPVAASFTDSGAKNYAHWITEVLSKICLFCAEPRFADIPIIVDNGLHENIRESLRLVVGNNREVIFLSPRHAINVGELLLTSTAGYAPAGFRKRQDPKYPLSFNTFGLQAVRDLCVKAATSSDATSRNKLIAFRRSSKTRPLLNQEEIYHVLEAYGFTLVEPGSMPFLEQIALVRSAKIIVSPVGAELTNIMFCTPGTRIIALARDQVHSGIYYWQSIAFPFGVNLLYLFGQGENSDVHSGFRVNTQDLHQVLDKFLKPNSSREKVMLSASTF